MQSDDPKIAHLLEERGKWEKQLSKYEDIVKNIDAIDRVLKIYGYNPSKTTIANGQPVATVKHTPSEYSKTLTWERRVLFALNAIGEGFVDDVANKIHDIDADIDVEAAKKRSTLYLSKLYRDGNIKLVSREGRKFKYGIKE